MSKADSGGGTGRERRAGLRRGQRLVARIESLAHGGEGVTKDPGMPVFVNRTAPGDLAEIEIFDVRKDFARGRLVAVVEPSPQRSDPPCKLFKVCGGCQLQHIDYAWQLRNKEEVVRQAIQRIGALDPDLVLPVVPAAQPLFYRNKVQFPVAHPRRSRRLLAGYFKQDSHELVNIKHCPVQPEPLDRLLSAVKQLCEDCGVSAYDEASGAGLLRHITARYSRERGDVLVTLVVNLQQPAPGAVPAPPAALGKVAEGLMQAVPEVVGVCLNFNDEPGNRIFGTATVCLAGQEHLLETLRTGRADLPQRLRQGLTFRLSPTSFFQVNTAQAVRLLEEVADAVGGDCGVLLDAYAGVGTMALWLSPLAGRVVAVEEHEAAVVDGEYNRELNAIDNVQFRLGRVEEAVPRLLADHISVDVVVVDPPRKGLSAQASDHIIELSARRIVYVSCNPATLARDLRILDRNGYKTKRIQPIDMFPQTFHVETVALVERS